MGGHRSARCLYDAEAGYKKACILSTNSLRTRPHLALLVCCLLLLFSAPSLTFSIRVPFRVQPLNHDLQEPLRAASSDLEDQNMTLPSEHDVHEDLHVVARELASAKPPAPQNVAHTDYICADLC